MKRIRTMSNNSIEPDQVSEVIWLTNHKAVGIKVAKYFGPICRENLYCGVVTKFAPPSVSTGKDHMYHILFEDSDEEDWDEAEFRYCSAYHIIFVQHGVTADMINNVLNSHCHGV
jgi:hypothetical protein